MLRIKMDRKKRVTLYRVFLSLLAVVVVFLIYRSTTPQWAFKKKFGFALPRSAEIVNEKYIKWDPLQAEFTAKIRLNAEAEKDIEAKFDVWFGSFHTFDILNTEELGGFYRMNYYDWWDLDKTKIKKFYTRMVDGDKNIFGYGAKTATIWAFITEAEDGDFYLYIAS
jgi:hypothetical protein